MKKKKEKEMKGQKAWLYGWKSICDACDILSVSTMKGIASKYDMPIKEINGKPAIAIEELTIFLKNLPRKKM